MAPLWNERVPGVSFHGPAPRIPPDVGAVIGYVDDDGNAESAGYHTDLGGFFYGVVDVGQSDDPGVTLSHEGVEMAINPRLSRKRQGPDGRGYYVEPNDPVQGFSYTIKVTLLGETRQVPVSDFTSPAFWGLPNPLGVSRLSYLDRAQKPFTAEEGGYLLAESPDGAIAMRAAGEVRINRSSFSRTRRIITKRFARGI